MREVRESTQQHTQERRRSDAKSRRQTSYSTTFTRIRTKWESKHSEAMDQNTETEKARRTQKEETAQAEIKIVRVRGKKGKTQNRQKLNCKKTQQSWHSETQKNEETRTRRFEEDGNGKSAEKQDRNSEENNTENRTTNRDESSWISTIAKTTEEKAEGDESKETTHKKTHNPEGTQSTTNVTMETFLQFYCIIPEGKKGERRKTVAETQQPKKKLGKTAH